MMPRFLTLLLVLLTGVWDDCDEEKRWSEEEGGFLSIETITYNTPNGVVNSRFRYGGRYLFSAVDHDQPFLKDSLVFDTDRLKPIKVLKLDMYDNSVTEYDSLTYEPNSNVISRIFNYSAYGNTSDLYSTTTYEYFSWDSLRVTMRSVHGYSKKTVYFFSDDNKYNIVRAKEYDYSGNLDRIVHYGYDNESNFMKAAGPLFNTNPFIFASNNVNSIRVEDFGGYYTEECNPCSFDIKYEEVQRRSKPPTNFNGYSIS